MNENMIRTWLDWANAFEPDEPPLRRDYITEVREIFTHQGRLAHLDVRETTTRIRLYVDDELGYLDLLGVSEGNELTLLTALVDTDWLIILPKGH